MENANLPTPPARHLAEDRAPSRRSPQWESGNSNSPCVHPFLPFLRRCIAKCRWKRPLCKTASVIEALKLPFTLEGSGSLLSQLGIHNICETEKLGTPELERAGADSVWITLFSPSLSSSCFASFLLSLSLSPFFLFIYFIFILF